VELSPAAPADTKRARTRRPLSEICTFTLLAPWPARQAASRWRVLPKNFDPAQVGHEPPQQIRRARIVQVHAALGIDDQHPVLHVAVDQSVDAKLVGEVAPRCCARRSSGSGGAPADW